MIARLTRFRTAAVSLTLLGLAALSVSAEPPISLERVSVSSSELEDENPSYGTLGLSSDGRYVAFTSNAEAWVPQFAQNFQPDIWVRDRKTGITELVSVATSTLNGRAIGNGRSYLPSISDNGRFVAFVSNATNFAGVGITDDNNASDIFYRDRRGRTTRVSVGPGSAQANGASTNPHISGNGEFVAFQSDATNLDGADQNDSTDVFVHQVDTSGFGFLGITTRVSEDEFGVEGDGPSSFPSISADGRFVAFQSQATNLHPDDTDPNTDIYVKDMTTGAITLVSVDDAGLPGDGESTLPAISADGQFVAFVSTSTNLVLDDFNDVSDVFVRDLVNGITLRVSIDSDGVESPDLPSGEYLTDPILGRPTLSADGNLVAFISDAALEFDDSNDAPDVYIHNVAEALTERLSISTDGFESDGASLAPVMTPDGSVVAYQSDGTALVDDDFNDVTDVFVATIGESSVLNLPPVADAGFDQVVTEGDVVTLDASGSSDPNNDPLSFLWRQVDGPTVTLSSTTSQVPSFTAPLVDQFEVIEFEVVVSDGINEPDFASVFIEVSAAPPAVLTGSVRDIHGNGIQGALVTAVRSDGVSAIPIETDENGNYIMFDLREGLNTITASAPGYEPAVRTINARRLEIYVEQFGLQAVTTTLRGEVLQRNGQPVGEAAVELLDVNGDVLDSTTTDADGTYLLDKIDRFALSAATTLRVSKEGYIDWLESTAGISSGTENVRNFRYGDLVVLVDTKPAKLRKNLDGTMVQILIGDKVVADNEATKKVRRLVFTNVPATTVKIRAVNPNLTASQVLQRVGSGPRQTKTVIKLLRKGVF